MDDPTPTARIEDLLVHADWVRRIALHLGLDAATADDVAQETWLAAIERPPPRDRPTKAWLGGVARNLSRMHGRGEGRRRRREHARAEATAPEPPTVSAVERLELQRNLADAILRLEEPYRSTVVRRYLDGRSSAEIARQEGVPGATVRGRLKRALDFLRQDLDRRYGGRRRVWLLALAPFLISPTEPGVPGAPSPRTPPMTPSFPLVLVASVVALLTGAVLLTGVVSVGDGGRAPPAGPAPAGPPAPAERPAENPAAPTSEPEPDDASAPEPDRPPVRAPAPRAVETYEPPAGMVRVPKGQALIGTTDDRLAELLRSAPRVVRKDFLYEVPQHVVSVGEFFLDRYEVSNAQYHRFLQDTALASYDTSAKRYANLEEVAGALTRVPRDRWGRDTVAWRQLLSANEKVLRAKMEKWFRDGSDPDLLRHAPLPPGIRLVFYDRKPPETWPGLAPSDEMLDQPVTSVSYDDAEAFAEWAGKHVPTEVEWEYAARGPEGRWWPWGNEWYPDTRSANWGGQMKDPATHESAPMSVETLPEGRSWCGAHHMLGNAAEWTSSWFRPYPGNDRQHHYMGEFVKVIRGASHADESPLALRLATRNFMGAGVKAPPRPGNRFEYVGFRCAWYGRPGQDRVGPILRRVARGRRITAKHIARDRFAGAVTTHFAATESEVEHHAYVRERARAVVLLPLTAAFRVGRPGWRISDRGALMKASREARDPIPLGVLHTDVEIGSVYVRAPQGDGRGRDRTGPPGTVEGTCPPGTYVLGLWWDRLCLCRESLDFVCFLTRSPAQEDEVRVRSLGREQAPMAWLAAEPAADRIVVALAVPIAGMPADANACVVVEAHALRTKSGALHAAGRWR